MGTLLHIAYIGVDKLLLLQCVESRLVITPKILLPRQITRDEIIRNVEHGLYVVMET